MDPVRVLTLCRLRAGGLGAVHKVAALPLRPRCGIHCYRARAAGRLDSRIRRATTATPRTQTCCSAACTTIAVRRRVWEICYTSGKALEAGDRVAVRRTRASAL